MSRILDIRQLQGLWVGLGVALLGLMLNVTPFGDALEERYGLQLLFWLRGARPSPPEVVIITIDRVSAEKLGQSEKPDRWPRDLHGRLVRHLAKAGAQTIVFDMFFKSPHAPNEDAALADAMRSAGNVAIVEEQDDYAKSTPPVGVIADSAAVVAPFLLPNAERVDGFWTFKTDPDGNPNFPTLPVAGFQIYALQVYDELLRILQTLSPNHARTLPASKADIIANRGVEALAVTLRDLLHSNPELGRQVLEQLVHGDASALPVRKKRIIEALINLYSGDEWQYLNFYGPAGSIHNVPFVDALTILEPHGIHSENVFAGKIVLVGFFEWSPVKQKDKDAFNTAFTRPDGLKLSGVEIGATAIANLVEDMPIRRLDFRRSLALVVIWGVLLGVVWQSVSMPMAAGLSLAVALPYAYGTFEQFKLAGVWLPLVVPLVQSAIGIFSAVLLKRREAERLIEEIRDELGRYLPRPSVEQLLGPRRRSSPRDMLVYGTCLHTDISGYTAIARRVEPVTLSHMMDDYYRTIGLPVTRWGGNVCDTTGDSMLAVWAASEPDSHLRSRACHGALDIIDALDRFNEMPRHPALPTRFGLHSGQIVFGNLGATRSRQHRAFGLIVNTASRIQELNKQLHTRILASAEVLANLDDLLARPVGTFLLHGLGSPLELFELIGPGGDPRNDVPGGPLWLCAAFAEGLEAYRQRDWQWSSERFLEILDRYPQDGPSRFYLNRSESHRIFPPDERWDAVVEMQKK